MKLIKLLWLCVLTLIISGCGGGGSANKPEGSQPPTINNFSLKLSQTAISAKCYTDQSCSVNVRADYQGDRPSGTIYIISNLGDKVDFSYFLQDTYAEMNFSTPHGTPKGNYKGNVTIDICGDQACNKRYGPRYTLPYEWTVMSRSITLSYGLLGSSERTISNYDLRISSVMGVEPDIYEMDIDMPGEATHVDLPQEFIDLYQVVSVSATRFHLKPPNYPTGVYHNYSLVFTGPNNYLASMPISVAHQFVKQASPLPEQVAYTSFHDATFGSDFYLASAGNYSDILCGEASLKISLEMLTKTETPWLSQPDRQACALSLMIAPNKNNYGIYEGSIAVNSDKTDTQILPIVVAYSKNEIDITSYGIHIYQDTTAEILENMSNSFIIRGAESSFIVSAVSPWLSDLQLSYDTGAIQTYSFNVDINEFKKINPLNSGIRWSGVAKIDNTNPGGNFGLALIDVSISVPLIFAIETKTAEANTAFSEKIYGASLSDFKGVEIVKLGLDADGKYANELSREFYYCDHESDDRNNTLTFDMPALSAGVYKLNFSGIFSHHFPDFILEVK